MSTGEVETYNPLPVFLGAIVCLPIGVPTAICGIIAGIFARNKAPDFTLLARVFLMGGSHILSGPYHNILKIINPEAKLESYIGEDKVLFENNWFTREIGGRVYHVGFAIGKIALRILAFVPGIVAGFIAFATLGKYEGLNSFAFNALQLPAIVDDIYILAVKLINVNIELNP